MPWGQSFDEWHATAPSYKGDGHMLGYDPRVHQEGKGFLLTDGFVWTWPTKDLRPMHMAYSGRVKASGKQTVPGTAFHIDGDGGIYFWGEGRAHTPEQQKAVLEADPRLHYGGERKKQLWEEEGAWDSKTSQALDEASEKPTCGNCHKGKLALLDGGRMLCDSCLATREPDGTYTQHTPKPRNDDPFARFD